MRNTLFIVSLYLILSACGEKSNEVKFTSEGNPVVMDKFTSDPAPMVHNGRLYLYVGHDEAEEGQDFNITEWLCYSTAGQLHILPYNHPVEFHSTLPRIPPDDRQSEYGCCFHNSVW